MKKMRKGKKMLLLFLIAIVVVIATIVIINIVNKHKKTEISEEVNQVIPLPETTYSEMQVKNIQMEFLKDNNETMVSMEIHNTTSVKVENDSLYAILIGPDDNKLGETVTYIQSVDPGEQYNISVVLKGDLTATKQIKLVEK